jgi:hypothetical protein
MGNSSNPHFPKYLDGEMTTGAGTCSSELDAHILTLVTLRSGTAQILAAYQGKRLKGKWPNNALIDRKREG